MLEHVRVNITPIAKRFGTEGYQNRTPQDDPLLRPCELDSPEACQMWSDIKPEFFALLSVFADRVIDRAYQQRVHHRPFGLVNARFEGLEHDPATVHTMEDVDVNSPFASLGIGMRDTLYVALMEEMQDLRSGNASPQLTPALNRADRIVQHVSSVLLRLNQTTEATIAGGITTASDFMAGLLGVIPAVGELEDTDHLLQIAANSYPLVGRIAMEHAEVIVPLMRVLRGRGSFIPLLPFEPKIFRIEDESDRPRLELSPMGQELLDEIRTGIDYEHLESGMMQSVTAGCPAMVNFNGGSAIRKMWYWHVEIAREVYPRLERK